MKKTTTIQTTLIAAALVMAGSLMSQAQPYQDQMTDGSTWGVNASGTNINFTFNYDYSADGIPEAPNTQGGDTATRGLKLEANLSVGASTFFTLFPSNQFFVGPTTLRFDAWQNLGSSGTTEFLGGGLGYQGVTADLDGGAQAIATSDGGSSSDWRGFKDGGFFIPGADMTAGTRQGSDPYYANFLPSTNGSVAGSPAFQWVTWEFIVDSNGIVTVTIEKPDNSRLEIVSYDKNDTSDGSSGSTTDGNISLFYADFFSSIGDAGNFGLIDNVNVSNVLATAVSVTSPDPDGAETGQDPATFTFTRSVTGGPLTASYSIGGLAANGVDYTNQLGGPLSGSITFSASDSSTNVVVVPIDDAISEAQETITLTVLNGPGYIAAGNAATASITDNDTPLLIISEDAPTMYERHTNDYASVTITRWGDLSVALSVGAGNFSFSGDAVLNTDYVLNTSVFPFFLNAGIVDTNIVNFVNPLDNSSYTGNKSFDVSLVAGGGFSVSNATASLTIIDDDNPAATVLYSNPLTSAADASNWRRNYANGDLGTLGDDGEARFGYNLSTDASGGGVIAPPPGGANFALRVAVNKTNASNAGLNLYMTNASFSGDYAVRFNMNLITDSDPSFSTQGPVFGINHNGNQTNWWAGSGISTNSAIQEWAADGLFYWVSADGGAIAGDYILHTGVGGALPNTGWKRESALLQTAFSQQFKGRGFFTSPALPGPYTGIFGPGLVANDIPGFGDNKTWSDVEIKQINNVVTMSINKTPVITYNNTNTWTSGHLMLGYWDPFSSLGDVVGAVYYANLSVVQVGPPVITDITRSGSDVTIDFTSNDGSATFTLESASVLTGPYTPVAGSVITHLSGGTYQATASSTAGQQYYRISQ